MDGIIMKVIIAGSRYFNNYELLRQYVDHILQNVSQKESIEIVSGGAKGADELGERYAKERGYKITCFPAEWNKYGRAAGPKRNEQMGDYADALIAFWDGESRGTKHMIEYAKKKNLLVRVKVPKSL